MDSNDFIHLVLGTITAKVGYEIHNSSFWAIIDFCFFPFAWAKWIIMEEVNLQIIANAFQFIN